MNNNEEILYGVIDNPKDALLLFYIYLLTMLNSTVISAPNLIDYAEAGGLIEKTINIPTEDIPNDAKIKFGSINMNFSHIRLMQNLQPKIAKFQTGTMSENELLSFVLESYYLNTQELKLNSVYTFFDMDISAEEMQTYYYLHLKNEKTEEESEKIDSFSHKLYDYYNKKINDK